MAERDLASIMRRAASALGYSALKAEQEQAITHFVNGNDVFVFLPTGYGKSLCFALLPRVFDILRDYCKPGDFLQNEGSNSSICWG